MNIFSALRNFVILSKTFIIRYWKKEIQIPLLSSFTIVLLNCIHVILVMVLDSIMVLLACKYFVIGGEGYEEEIESFKGFVYFPH